MKICLKLSKNIREIRPFLGAGIDVENQVMQMPYLSGVPPPGKPEKQTERAVIMSEFFQRYGT